MSTQLKQQDALLHADSAQAREWDKPELESEQVDEWAPLSKMEIARYQLNEQRRVKRLYRRINEILDGVGKL